MDLILIVIVTGAYLLGSIPSAVWIGKITKGVDVREHGSKNAGATNTMRVLGVKTGIPVLLIDVFKGFGAVLIASFSNFSGDAFVGLQIGLGAVAVLGHVFPVFAGFRGGKGVATIVGVLLALHWQATVVAIAVFLIILFISKYVSLGSMLMGVSFPVSVIFIFQPETATPPAMKIFSIIVCVLLFVTHRKNISRLIKGTENKATFLFRKART